VTDTIATTAHGTVTAPAAGAAVASLSGLTTGEYEINAMGYVTGGSPAAGDSDNLGIYVDGNLVETLPVVATATPSGLPPYTRVVETTQTGAIVVKAIGIGTASVAYHAFLTAAAVPVSEYR
jgi:hypothetical protein